MLKVILVCVAIGLTTLWFFINRVVIRKFELMIWNSVEVTVKAIVFLSLQFAFLASLILPLAIILISLVFEVSKEWSITGVISLIMVAGLLGLITFVGSLYKISTTMKYRDFLISKWGEKRL